MHRPSLPPPTLVPSDLLDIVALIKRDRRLYRIAPDFGPSKRRMRGAYLRYVPVLATP